MKKLYLGQTVGILANLGVITGIVFLGIELRQNNELQQAQARVARADSRQSAFRLLIENPDLRAALEAEEDNRLVRSFYNFVFTGWQYSFGEYEAGMIDAEDLDASGWGLWLRGPSALPGMLSYWERIKGTYRPSFVHWMDENVVSQQ